MNDFRDSEAEGIFEDGTVKIRFAIAAVLLVVVIILDINNKSIVGITTERLYQAIAMDYGTVIDTFVRTINMQ